MSNPCHIEVIVSEVDEVVAKAPENKIVKFTARQRGRSLAEQTHIAA